MYALIVPTICNGWLSTSALRKRFPGEVLIRFLLDCEKTRAVSANPPRLSINNKSNITELSSENRWIERLFVGFFGIIYLSKSTPCNTFLSVLRHINDHKD